nr:response regulator transcription factor [Anaerolineae bacterium]
MQPIRLVIADDHEVVQTGLEGMLASEPDIEIVGKASNGQEAVSLAAECQPDVILMDLRMPVMDGVEAIARIREQGLPVHVLVLTTYDTDADILRAVEAGATGYLLKDTPRDELIRAIHTAAQGESVLTPSVASRLMSRMRAPAEEKLSEREIEVLEQVARGASNQEIGETLHISAATVKSHLIHIYGKLGVSDRTAAVTTALERGIMRL